MVVIDRFHYIRCPPCKQDLPCLLMRMRYLSRRNIPVFRSSSRCIAMLTVNEFPQLQQQAMVTYLTHPHTHVSYTQTAIVVLLQFQRRPSAGDQHQHNGNISTLSLVITSATTHCSDIGLPLMRKFVGLFYPPGNKFQWNYNKISIIYIKNKMPLKMASVKWQPFGIHLNVLKRQWSHFSF